MSMLAFIPWLESTEPIRAGGFVLVPYERGVGPGGPLQPIYDSILEPYLGGEGESIGAATLLQSWGRASVADLSDDERADCFEFADLVGLAGLSAREYFNWGGYANRETFNLIIQSFQNLDGGVGLRSPRRDGGGANYLTKDAYRVMKPRSQDNVSTVKVDRGFLEGLVAARETPRWESLSDAVFFFNEANTDGERATEQGHTVFMHSAFERALQSDPGKVADLAARLEEQWPVLRRSSPQACSYIPPDQYRHGSVLTIWIRDFFKHRGDIGHGRRRSGHRAIWSAREHLLFGAYAFPLLVKRLLSMDGSYVLTDADLSDIEVFEDLLCERHFSTSSSDPREHPWNKVRNKHLLRRSLRRALEKSNQGAMP